MDIILMEAETAGNIGAIARVMKNFDFSRLVLVKPKCNHLSKEALDRSTHAKEILRKAKVVDKIENYDYLIGTTAILGTDYNIPRSPLNPGEMADKLSRLKKAKIGLLLGREGSGLTNKEINKCDFVVTIPASKRYATMNISHSLAVILYELFKKSKKEKISEHITPVSKKEKDVILKLVNNALNKMDFATKEKKETQRIVWKRVIGKAMLTKREAFALLGFLRKIK